MLTGIGRRLDAVLFFDLPDDVATERMVGRPGGGGEPPRRHARGDGEATRHLPCRDRADRRALPGRRQASSCRSTPSARSRRSTPRFRLLPGRARGRGLIIRKSAQGEIELMAAAGCRRRRDARAARGAARAPMTVMLELDAIADELHPLPAERLRPRRATRASCRDLHLAERHDRPHGIPSDYRAAEGDIISFDVGVTKDGLIADSAATFGVGQISDEAQRLLDVCLAALVAGLEAAYRPAPSSGTSPRPSSRSSRTPASRSSEPRRSRCRQVAYHEDPQIPNFVAGNRGQELVEGMTISYRADDHGRRPRRSMPTTTNGRSRPSTAPSRPTRAHRRDHRGGPEGAHESRIGPGTMTDARREPCFCLRRAADSSACGTERPARRSYV